MTKLSVIAAYNSMDLPTQKAAIQEHTLLLSNGECVYTATAHVYDSPPLDYILVGGDDVDIIYMQDAERIVVRHTYTPFNAPKLDVVVSNKLIGTLVRQIATLLGCEYILHSTERNTQLKEHDKAVIFNGYIYLLKDDTLIQKYIVGPIITINGVPANSH